MKSATLLLLATTACAGAQQRPPCTPEQEQAKAQIEAELFAEGFQACYGNELEECEAFPAIREKYRRRRDAAWRACE